MSPRLERKGKYELNKQTNCLHVQMSRSPLTKKNPTPEMKVFMNVTAHVLLQIKHTVVVIKMRSKMTQGSAGATLSVNMAGVKSLHLTVAAAVFGSVLTA